MRLMSCSLATPAICFSVIVSSFSSSVMLFLLVFCQLYALCIVFLCCDAYYVFMHCGTIFDLPKFEMTQLDNLSFFNILIASTFEQ